MRLDKEDWVYRIAGYAQLGTGLGELLHHPEHQFTFSLSRFEAAVHETGHAVVLGLRGRYDEGIVEWALTGRPDARMQEIKTLCAEVLVLEYFGFEGLDTWLDRIENNLYIPSLKRRVVHRLKHPKKRAVAQRHARLLLRRLKARCNKIYKETAHGETRGV